MRNVLQTKLWLGCLTLLLWTNCSKKEADLPLDPNGEYTLTLKLKGFAAEITPLSFRAGSSTSTVQNLYYWSFNNENTVPDEAIHASGASITFEGSEYDFTTGWGASPYVAGKGFNTKGMEYVVITMPLQGVSQLADLTFDVGSSSTGPKNFKLYYSTDGGATYTILSEDNQFTNFSTNGRNGFQFDLSLLSDINYEGSLSIKIEPFEGDRGEGGSAYNPNTGTFKIDNFRLSGYPSEDGTNPGTAVNKIHYHIFDAQNHTLVDQGAMPFNASQVNPELSIRLPKGHYYASILSNASKAELVFPETLTQASQFYIGNPFANKTALIFGATISDLVVDQNTQLEVILKRYFSEVSFEFTDTDGLSDIGKIRIVPEHAAFFYNPFGSLSNTPPPVQQAIEIFPEFTADHRSISFHQYMGDLAEPVQVAYTVRVYDKGQALLREFSVSSSLKNNVQLLFRGLLLEGIDQSSGFQIQWNDVWDEPQTEEF